MCTKCLPTETAEQHKERHPGVAKQSNDPDFNAPLYAFRGHKMLCQISTGEIIYVVGRLLQPFCSHAVYRVKVLDLRHVGNECLVIHGSLIDFKDSPVQSHAIEAKQLFRWEIADVVKLTREDIERIVRAQGLSVGIRESHGSLGVTAWKYLRTERNEQGKKRSVVEKHWLGKLDVLLRMSEEDIAGMVRSKFGMAQMGEAEKVEVMQ